MTVTINGTGTACFTDASGNVGIGTTTPTAKLDVTSGNVSVTNTQAGLTLTSSTTANPFLAFNAPSLTNSYVYLDKTGTNFIVGNSPYGFGWQINSVEVARIDGSGNFLINTTSTAQFGKLSIRFNPSVNNGIGFLPTASGTNNACFFLNSIGGGVGTIQCNDSTTSYNTSSDYRLKENIQPMQDALAKVALLNPVTYNWKVDGSDGEGFIAHELQTVVPNAVTGQKDAVDTDGKPIYQGVDYSKIVVHLVAAIQELKAEIDALKGGA